MSQLEPTTQAFIDSLARDPQRILNVMRVGVRFPGRPVKATELTVGIANIGGIEVPVHIEIGRPPMLSAPDKVRHSS